MKYILAFCLLMICTAGQAQMNLVPNPSFEDTISCPNSGGQVWKAKYWETVANSPDYFHTCHPFIQYWVPYNNFGYQWPNSGDAYMGLWSYSASVPLYREIIGSQLLSPLSIGQKYFVSFKANVAFKPSAGTNAACNKIGVLLSTIKYLNNSSTITNNCQVFTDSILKDSINWVTVRGVFIADSAYSFISIGNFFSNANTDTVHLANSNTHQAYYYIDDVCLSTDSLYCEVFTGLPEEVKRNDIKVYPNPASDEIILENISFGSVSIVIYDVNGKKIIDYIVGQRNKIKLNIRFLKNGIYMLRINNKYSPFSFKFLKSNN